MLFIVNFATAITLVWLAAAFWSLRSLPSALDSVRFDRQAMLADED